MSLNCVDRSRDDAIISLVRRILSRGAYVSETFDEHVLVKLMQLRGTPLENYTFDQEKVDNYFDNWQRGIDGPGTQLKEDVSGSDVCVIACMDIASRYGMYDAVNEMALLLKGPSTDTFVSDTDKEMIRNLMDGTVKETNYAVFKACLNDPTCPLHECDDDVRPWAEALVYSGWILAHAYLQPKIDKL